MEFYDHKKIEKKWQKKWEKDKTYQTKENSDKDTFYVLDMFPYPSGVGLHVGHPKGYIATDVLSRHKRMQGYNVLHPMGWDAFGLPAENYALKTKTHPKDAVDKNIKTFKKQLSVLGLDYDWSREINTTDPEYYKWTQWIFIKMFEKGLAYQSDEPINWCPSCKTGLAMEDLENGRCERCGSKIEKKNLRQWVLKITDYADRLLNDLEGLDWPESIKESQRNWIGRSRGTLFNFDIKNTNRKIKVFTTRADTLFGVTHIVLAPENDLVDELKDEISNFSEVQRYREQSAEKTDIERGDQDKEKTGVELKGIKAVHPASGEEVPVWIADYVLSSYGTGSVMAVPAHDQRDYEFAKKYGLPIKRVIAPLFTDPDNPPKDERGDHAYVGEGVLINSGDFDDLSSELGKKEITSKFGEEKVQYKLRDWVFSRQRYWGEPIPIIHCQKCGPVAVPESDLPVELPAVKSYEPTGTGESPLANISEWVNTKCPKCGGEGKRETNTMPQWAGSCWYYLRYMDPKNDKGLVDPEIEKKWSPVDVYVGGAEHATRHLIYARFWHKFLSDIGSVSTEEPFKKLQHVGLILAEDGRKMSKSLENTVNPDDIIEKVGADAMRIYEMFMGPFDQIISWSGDGVVGPRRFLEKVWNLSKNTNHDGGADISKSLNKTIKKVSSDISTMNYNTAVSSMMELVNEMEDKKTEIIKTADFKKFLQILAPFAPHITEELWESFEEKESIHLSNWPEFDESQIMETETPIALQVNGKVRGEFVIPVDMSDDDVKKKALENDDLQKWIQGKNVKKIILVPGRLVNIVTDQ